MAMREIGPEVGAGAGAAAAKRGRTAARKVIENCILIVVVGVVWMKVWV